MPREQITYPKYRPVLDLRRPRPALNVNWIPGDAGHVQLSLNFDTEFLRGAIAELDESVSHHAFYTDCLSRQEINKLIRVLRTARDKAYGRDE